MRTLLHKGSISLDYIDAQDPGELHQGIRDTILGIGQLVLAIGLALVRVKKEALFLEFNCRNLTAYIEELARETKHDRGTIFNWLKIGETWLKYREDLEKIGFSDRDGPTKLAFLERALAHKPKNEVFDNLLIMSHRDFKVYSRKIEDSAKKKVPYWEIRGNILYIEGKRAAIINRNLGERALDMLIRALEAACMALERDGYILAVHLNSHKEMMHFWAAAKRLKKRIQREK